MAVIICFHCLKVKGRFDVCPYCGNTESIQVERPYQLPYGETLHDRYIMGPSIGSGGFGITYKAFDTALRTVVAVKEFYPAGLVNRGEGERKVGIFSGEKEREYKRRMGRFLEEARNLAMFSDEKSIVNVFDYFEENATAYIIMEYVDAPLLKDYLKEKGTLSIDEAVGYMLAILEALSIVHSHDIIHKDISPDNIFVTGPDTIKLFDFGAAKLSGGDFENPDHQNIDPVNLKNGRLDDIIVKAGYTPLEQYSSQNEQGPFMDIYAAGAVFYQMITGEKPLDAPARMEQDNIKRFCTFGIKGNKRLERVIFRALDMDPGMRYQTAEEFRDAVAGRKIAAVPQRGVFRPAAPKPRFIWAGAAVLAGVVLLCHVVLPHKPGTGMDLENMESCSLEVWLEADQDTGTELIQIMQERIEEECPQLTVMVKVFEADEYAGQLEQAAASGSLPEVFCTDWLSAEDYCEELSGLTRTIDPSLYLYFDDIMDGEIYEIPTSVQIGVAYVNENKTSGLPESIALEDLVKQEGVLDYADEPEVYSRFQEANEPVAWIAGDLSALDQVEEVTVEAVPPTDFAVLPVLKDKKLIGSLRSHYGINKQAADSQKAAGRYLLTLLLDHKMQTAAYMGSRDGIPLNKAAVDSYVETKMTTYLSALKEYKLEEAVIYEGGSICRIIREESRDENDKMHGLYGADAGS